MRADAKTAAYAALTPAHSASVTAIVSQVAAGTLDRRAAAQKIDALLTPDESKAVLAAADKSRAAMRAAGFAPPGRPPGAGGPPNAARGAAAGRRTTAGSRPAAADPDGTARPPPAAT